jgi:hypothetical protein
MSDISRVKRQPTKRRVVSSEQSLRTAKTDDAYRRALDLNIRAFEAQPVEWKEKLRGQFVLFHQGKFVDAFASFDNAARTAIKQFGRDCCLIREVGASFSEAQTVHHMSSR